MLLGSPSCSTFRVITTYFLGVRIFRKFTVGNSMSKLYMKETVLSMEVLDQVHHYAQLMQ